MNKDEEYVRSVWGVSIDRQLGCRGNAHRCWREVLERDGETSRAYLSGPLPFETEAEMWSAAAEFTRDWQGQVRQVREEIGVQQSIFEHAECFAKLSGQRDSHGLIATAEKRVAPVKRTLARLEAELTRLTAGMKPEAL